MRVAYVTDYDPADVHQWSGLPFYIMQCLRLQGLEVEPIGPISWRSSARALYSGTKFVIYNHLLAEKAGHYSRYLEPKLIKAWAGKFESRLNNRSFDLVFSPGTHRVAYLKTSIPIVTWTDATHAALVTTYNAERPLSRESLKGGHLLESRALNKVRLAVYSSDWAAASAIRDYGLAEERVCVIPFGPNVDSAPSETSVVKLIEARSRRKIELLFVGVDYRRKGLAKAVEVARELNAHGLPSRLTVIGCEPSINEPFVEVVGFLSKARQEDRTRLASLFGRSHFLLLPAKAECYGLVLCEANSFGVPCIATTVGGIPSVIREGVNGYLFQEHTHARNMAASISTVVADWERYFQLAVSSYREYASRLNWNSAGTAVVRAIERVLAKGPR